MITPTRERPTLTFILLKIAGTEEGSTTFKRAVKRVPPRVSMSFSFSGSVFRKAVYRLIMDPKRATEIPATMIVVIPLPSHTIRRGARADFGRLFRIDKIGFGNFRKGFKVPQKSGADQSKESYEQKADQCFKQGDHCI